MITLLTKSTTLATKVLLPTIPLAITLYPDILQLLGVNCVPELIDIVQVILDSV